MNFTKFSEHALTKHFNSEVLSLSKDLSLNSKNKDFKTFKIKHQNSNSGKTMQSAEASLARASSLLKTAMASVTGKRKRSSMVQTMS